MNKNIVHVLLGMGIIFLAAIQMIDSQAHAYFYNFLTWFTWPSIFFAVGYLIDEKQKVLKSIFHYVKIYLIPYFSVGLFLIFINKIVQLFHLNPWLKTPFPAIKVGLKALLYGNGQPADTFVWPFETAIGALWILLALFCSSVINIVILKIKSINLRIISVLVVAVLGFYIGSVVQLPWSVQSAMIVQPFMLYGSQLKHSKKWQPTYAVLLAALISAWLMSYAGAYELTTAFSYHWILGTIMAFIAMNAVLSIAYLINTRLGRLANLLIFLGKGLNINIVLLGFISLIIPLQLYVSKLFFFKEINFLTVWVLTIIIMGFVKLIINKGLNHYCKSTEEVG